MIITHVLVEVTTSRVQPIKDAQRPKIVVERKVVVVVEER